MSYQFTMGFRTCETFEDALLTAHRCAEKLRAHQHEDENWATSIFTLRLVYWAEYKLLGIVGDIPGTEGFSEVYFQNGTDQDYPFGDWPDIPFFNGIVKRHKSMTVNELLGTGRWDGYTAAELAESLDYYRRTDAYDEVVEKLALDDWLYGRENPAYQRFSMCSLQSLEDAMNMAALARRDSTEG